ncbi:MAG: DNA adenine methylase [Planctomycetes bacterium]|nr:DNA adenine methylase [Planctomycetota bacterium]
MGSKRRLLPWLRQELAPLEPTRVLDAFCGTGCVSWMLRSLGAEVVANDFMRVGATLAQALVANPGERLGNDGIEAVCAGAASPSRFIQDTFSGIFYDEADRAFLDRAWSGLSGLSPPRRAVALAALARAAVKKQPRGVFTISGELSHYDDGRRDLRISMEGQFRESVAIIDAVVHDDGRAHRARFGDVFDIEDRDFDLVYLDPPYVPRSDDNCYIKRYHFIEGLMSYWQAPEIEIMESSKVKKLVKRRTPFSYRKTAREAFDRLFETFKGSQIALSYSSNGWPDLDQLVDILRAHKPKVEVHGRDHRYHFGTHSAVSAARTAVREYLVVGS